MYVECPHCRGRMASSQAGWLCSDCGHVIRHYSHDNVGDIIGDAIPNDLPAPKPELTPLPSTRPNPDPLPDKYHTALPQAEVSPLPINNELEADTHDQAPPIVHQAIINHHASSHYRQRLRQRLDQLDELELPSPLDESTTLSSASSADTRFATALAPAPSPQPIDAPRLAKHTDSPSIEPQPDLPEEASEDTTPIKPSAYVVEATSPLDARPATEPAGDSQWLRSAHNAPIDPAADRLGQAHANPSPDALQALKKADALLAAAASSPAASQSAGTRKWGLLIGGVVLLVSAGLGAWWLLRPAPAIAPVSSVTPTPQKPLNLSPSTDASKRDATRKSDLNTIAIGLEAYHKSTGAYPVGNDIAILTPLEHTAPAYITKINYDPLTKTDDPAPIKYSYVSDGSSFTLSATLENPQDEDGKNGLYIVRSTQ